MKLSNFGKSLMSGALDMYGKFGAFGTSRCAERVPRGIG